MATATGNTDCSLWIVLGDIHDNIGRLQQIPELTEARGILVSGDLTQGGKIPQAKRIMQQLLTASPVVWAQVGNMDYPEVTGWLASEGRNLHGEVHELVPGVAMIGAGASTVTPFGTPSELSEDWYAACWNRLWETAGKYPHVIVISHNPPKDTACDVVGNNLHVGSTALRAFIERTQPDICFCGHIHEARAMDHIGRTLVINPGAFMDGGYAILRLDAKDGNRPAAEMRMLPAE